MSSDPNIFDCLLGPKEMFNLYQRIGTVLKNSRDIANELGQGREVCNSLSLLLNTEMIHRCDNEYSKTKNYETPDTFFSALLVCVKTIYTDAINAIVNCDKHYDEMKNQFYIFVNAIPLKYMGLTVLMEQAGEFERIKNKEYFVGIKEYRNAIKKKPQISIEELQKRLAQDVEHGEQAERFALQYEQARLKSLGINKMPLAISSVDVMAGYDMVSYESIESENYDRFIEVKAISKTGFFWSKNEYEVAKLKGERYYLYLVELNRINDPEYVPEMVQNPAINVMELGEWFAEPQSYHVKRV